MKNSLIKLAGALLLAAGLGSVGYADDITAIMGSGIPADGWATSIGTPSTSNNSDGVQVGLRARAEFGATLTHVSYSYYTVTGVLDATHALWNIDFSINSDMDGSLGGGLNNLTAYTYQLGLVSGPGGLKGLGNPFLFTDNAYGNNATLAGGGVYDNNPAAHNIAQNSENAMFYWPGIDPTVAGVYEFTLEAIPLEGAQQPNPIALTSIWVNVVGVPDGGTTALLLGLGLLGVSFIARHRKTV